MPAEAATYYALAEYAIGRKAQGMALLEKLAALPNAPGMIGTYQYACQLALGLFGVLSGNFLLVLVALFGIVLPLRAGEQWVGQPVGVGISLMIPLVLVASWAADTFAGERERHTLETLLATWGLSLFMCKGIEIVFGGGYKSVKLPLADSVPVFGVAFPAYRLALMVLCTALALFSGSMVDLLAALPAAVLTTIAGLALFNPLEVLLLFLNVVR